MGKFQTFAVRFVLGVLIGLVFGFLVRSCAKNISNPCSDPSTGGDCYYETQDPGAYLTPAAIRLNNARLTAEASQPTEDIFPTASAPVCEPVVSTVVKAAEKAAKKGKVDPNFTTFSLVDGNNVSFYSWADLTAPKAVVDFSAGDVVCVIDDSTPSP
jgi:hypothetical protein